MSARRRALALALALLACPAAAGPARALPLDPQEPVNFVILVARDSWLSAFEPLREAREALDRDHEGGRAWRVSVVPLSLVRIHYGYPDTTAIRSMLSEFGRLLPAGEDLFLMLVGDANDPFDPGQEEWNDLPMRYLFDPPLGYWSDHVSTDDLYADADGDGRFETIPFRLPAHSRADCEAYVEKAIDLLFLEEAILRSPSASSGSWRDPPPAILDRPDLLKMHRTWSDRIAASGVGGGGRAAWTPALRRATVLAEDADREGRSGELVRRHGEELAAILGTGSHSPLYAGDPDPYDYAARERLADDLDNAGHQIRISLGTLAHAYSNVNFQDIQRGWSIDHLLPGILPFFHLALSCEMGNIDADEIDPYGRPMAERILFAPGRGAFAVIGPTRTGYQFPYYWFGAEAAARIASRAQAGSRGATVGRIWRDAKEALRQTRPEHRTFWSSLIGLGDPTTRILPGDPQVVSVAAGDGGKPGIQAAPNPFSVATTLTWTAGGSRLAAHATETIALEIFDAGGRRVRRERLAAGDRSFRWDGRDGAGRRLVSGVYIVALRCGIGIPARRIVLID